MDTCLYELVYSEHSTLPLPKIFTTPAETPSTLIAVVFAEHITIIF